MRFVKILCPILFITIIFFDCKNNPTEPKSAALGISKNSLTLSNEKNEDLLILSNKGDNQLTWNITNTPDWLVLSKQNGTITTKNDTILFSADINKELGEYSGKINITSNGGNKEISVILLIKPTIYPGVGVAGINLGDTYIKIRNLFDNPSSIGIVTQGGYMIGKWVKYSTKGLCFFLDGENVLPSLTDTVTSIQIESPFNGVTEKNIGIGNSITEIINSYGEPTVIPSGVVYKYTHLGINFEIKDDKVMKITCFPAVPLIQPDSTSSITDIDGNVYKTIKLGNQWWLAENLKVTRYRNGDLIPNITDGSEWSNLSTGAYCYYNNDIVNATDYGALYNWYAVKDSRNIAPIGWHVPKVVEWETLIDYLGGDHVADEKLKEKGTSHWQSPNSGATNETCFTALPGGGRYDRYLGMGMYVQYWSISEYGSIEAGYINMTDSEVSVNIYDGDKHYGYSVRLVRDN